MSARTPTDPGHEVNPPPPQAAVATFVLREVVALLFVGAWLTLFALDLWSDAFELPFWFHVIGVGVLAYALGINVADLTAFRPSPSPLALAGQAVGQAVSARREE